MEKPKKTISSDYIQNKLKLGWVMQDFCDDLGISEESLMEFIEKHSNNRVYAAFPRRVKQNEQLAEKRRRSEEKKLNSAATNIDANNQASDSVVKTETTPQIPATEKVEVDPILAAIDSLSNKIKIKESDLTNKLKLKSQLSAEHESLSLRIIKLQSNVERLEKELELEKKNLSNSNHRIKVIANHISSVEQDISRIESAISDYKSEIRELQKITIFISKNDEIILESTVKIPDSWTEQYPKLLADSIVENITVKQVQLLAKLLVLFEKLKKEGAYFEFIFENDSSNGKDSVKTLFELLTEKI